MKNYLNDKNFIRARKLSLALTKQSSRKSISNILKEVQEYLPQPNGACIVPTSYGFSMTISPKIHESDPKKMLPGYLDNNIYYLGTYEAGTNEFILNRLTKHSTFIDVGSHYGLMSLVASTKIRKPGRIISIEPVPENYNKLIDNIKLNKIISITPLRLAVGDTNQMSKIFPHLTKTMLASLDPKGDIKLFDKPLNVKIKTLDSIVSEQKINKVDMIKIDAEGSELKALKGSQKTILKDRPDLIIEYTRDKTGKNKILNYIKKTNLYTIYRLKNGRHYASKLVPVTEYLNPSEYEEVDNLFCIAKNRDRF